jgi:hypothetical protein
MRPVPVEAPRGRGYSVSVFGTRVHATHPLRGNQPTPEPTPTARYHSGMLGVRSLRWAFLACACLGVACPSSREPVVLDSFPPPPEEPPPPRIRPVYTPCALPPSVAGIDLPRVDLDDPAALFQTGALPLIDIRFPDGAWEQACVDAKAVADQMDAIRRGQASGPLERPTVRVDVVAEGRTLYDVGFRFRGQSNLYAMFYDRWNRPVPGSLEACQADRMKKKPSYKLDLDEFVPDRRVGEQRTFDLGGREGSDASYLREVTAQHVARQFGLPAPLVAHARVCRDGVYDGLFSLPEEADFRGILRRLFPDASEGAFWEIISPADQTWRSGWTDSEGWQQVYKPTGGTDKDDIGRLGDLLDAGTAAKAGADLGSLDGLIDADVWLRNIALDMVIPDYDGMMGNHKNHVLYDHPDRGILPIGYDRDLAFVDLGNYLYGLCAGSIWGANPCWSSRRTPPLLAEYLVDSRPQAYTSRVEELLDGPLRPETLFPVIVEAADAIRPWVLADRYYQPGGPACDSDPVNCQWYTPQAWEYEVVALQLNIEDRIEEVRRQLDGTFVCAESCVDPPYIWLADRIWGIEDLAVGDGD